MEFSFNINNVIGEDITVVDNKLRPFRNNHASSTYRSQLSTIIDSMGEASAKAQGLNGTITTASKLSHSNHRLYIMKDNSASENSGGSVVGILKVGCRKLFLYDHHGSQHEREPLCVLDFYVHESKQRMGCGKKLFEAMLEAEQVKPVHMAIDRPSDKFLRFLSRHYGLKALVKQVNNFVIFEGFFHGRPAESTIGNRKPPLHTYKHNNSDRRQQQVDPVVACRRGSLGSSAQSPLQLRRETSFDNVLPRENGTEGGERIGSGRKNNSLPGSPVHRGMGAQQSMYSRHQEVGSQSPGTVRNVDGTPPLRRRDGPSQDFLTMAAAVNAQRYQDKRGHLVLSAGVSPTKDLPPNPSTSSQGEAAARSAHTQLVKDSSWNVLGVPRTGQRSASQQRHQQTRLW